MRLAMSVLAALVSASVVRADFVCDALGDVRSYGLIAQSGLRATQSPVLGYANTIYPTACVGKAYLQGSYVDSYTGALTAALVATKASGVALKLRRGRGQYSNPNALVGDLVTGGGRINGDVDPVSPRQDYTVDGAIDTSGTSPEVPRCRAAMQSMLDASDTFAALPAERTLGSLVVGPDDPSVTIQLAPGEVVQLDELITRPGRIDSYDGVRQCSYHHYPIAISGGPGVVNVERLEIGACTEVDVADGIVINLPGPGRAVRVDFDADLLGPVLAPHRTVKLSGTDYDDGTNIGAVWARKVLLSGDSIVRGDYQPSCRPGECTEGCFTIDVDPERLAVDAGAATVATVSTSPDGTPQPIALTATGLPSGATASFDPESPTAGMSSTLTIAASASTAPGFYVVNVSGTTAAATHTASAGLHVIAPATPLANGVEVTDIGGPHGFAPAWSIDVPVGQQELRFTLGGGTGDSDIYVRYGAQPDIYVSDCASGSATNTEECTIANPYAGTWYVMVYVDRPSAGVSLLAQYSQ